MSGVQLQEETLSDLFWLTGSQFIWTRTLETPVLVHGQTGVSKALSEQITCLASVGMIGNHVELTQRLGLPSDTAKRVLLGALYLRYRTPEQVASAITGTCAWVLWDGERRQLIAARDRVGVYGICYAVRDATVAVACQPESVAEALNLRLAPNPRAVVAQIAGRAAPEAETFFVGVNAVAPGSVLVITPGHTQSRRYWSIKPHQILRLPSDEAYADALRGVLHTVTGEYAAADTCAVTLSAGMDSTTVAAALRAVQPGGQLVAVAWTAPELPEADEGPIAVRVAEHLRLPVATIRADLCWPLRSSEGINTRRSTPFYNYYTELWDVTFERIRELGIHVVFSGISGDHLFGGDVFAYADMLATGRWKTLFAQMRSTRSPMSWPTRIRRMMVLPTLQAYFPRMRRFVGAPVPWLRKEQHDLHYDLRPTSDAPFRRLPGVQARLNLLRDPLLPQIVEAANQQAAAHGLELRHPLLDHRLFEFATSLPTDQVFRSSVRKIIVRNAMREYLPDEVVDRPDKIYPSAIARRGLREREQTKVWSYMTGMRVAELGYVDEKALQDAYSSYLAGKTESAIFWHTLTLEDWLRRYF